MYYWFIIISVVCLVYTRKKKMWTPSITVFMISSDCLFCPFTSPNPKDLQNNMKPRTIICWLSLNQANQSNQLVPTYTAKWSLLINHCEQQWPTAQTECCPCDCTHIILRYSVNTSEVAFQQWHTTFWTAQTFNSYLDFEGVFFLIRDHFKKMFKKQKALVRNLVILLFLHLSMKWVKEQRNDR